MKASFKVNCPDASWSRSCEIPLEKGGAFAKELADNFQIAMDLYELRNERRDTLYNLEKAIEVLRMIAQNSYGTEICNSKEENNEILANHYFINQQLAREFLEKIKR